MKYWDWDSIAAGAVVAAFIVVLCWGASCALNAEYEAFMAKCAATGRPKTECDYQYDLARKSSTVIYSGGR